MRHCLMVLCAFFLSWEMSAQSNVFTYSGTITDPSTGTPVEGAIVSSHEDVVSCSSDSLGRFSLRGLASGSHHIHVEAIGYVAQAFYVQIPCADVQLVMVPTELELKQVLIENTVTRSDYLKESIDMIVLRSSDLESGRGMGLAQSLSQLPGINDVKVGVAVAKPVIRGLSGNRILVVDLGTKQEGQQWGSDHGLEIDQFVADRIEIIKGPATVIYGSDALGGVLNILPPAAPVNPFGAEVQSIFRSNNNYIATTAMAEVMKNKRFFRVRATWADFGDFRVPADQFVYLRRNLPIENERLKNTAGNELHWRASAGTSGDWGTLKVTLSSYHQLAGLFPGIVGVPTVPLVRDDGDDRNVDLPRAEVNHLRGAVNAAIRTKNGWLQWDTGIQHNQREEQIRPHREGYGPLPNSNVSLQLRLLSFQSSVRWHQQKVGNWRWIPGLSVSAMEHRRNGFEFLLPNYTSAQAGVFLYGEHDQKDKNIVWNGGFRLDGATFKNDAFFTPVYSSEQVVVDSVARAIQVSPVFFNYSGALGLSWVPSEKWNFKANASKSFRTPNAAELSINGIHHGTFRHEMGDPNLRAEQGYQLDVVVVRQVKESQWKFSPYVNYFDGYIYLRPMAEFSTLPGGGQLYRYSQHDALFTGAEMAYEFHPLPPLHTEVAVEYVHSYNLNTGLALPFTPPLQFKSKINYEWENAWQPSLGVFVRNAFQQNQTDRNEKKTPGFTTVDLYGQVMWKYLECVVQLNNVFDVSYFNHLSVYRQLNLPEPGRNISVSLKIPLSIEKKRDLN